MIKDIKEFLCSPLEGIKNIGFGTTFFLFLWFLMALDFLLSGEFNLETRTFIFNQESTLSSILDCVEAHLIFRSTLVISLLVFVYQWVCWFFEGKNVEYFKVLKITFWWAIKFNFFIVLPIAILCFKFHLISFIQSASLLGCYLWLPFFIAPMRSFFLLIETALVGRGLHKQIPQPPTNEFRGMKIVQDIKEFLFEPVKGLKNIGLATTVFLLSLLFSSQQTTLGSTTSVVCLIVILVLLSTSCMNLIYQCLFWLLIRKNVEYFKILKAIWCWNVKFCFCIVLPILILTDKYLDLESWRGSLALSALFPFAIAPIRSFFSPLEKVALQPVYMRISPSLKPWMSYKIQRREANARHTDKS